jgi:hypothetical protein
VRVIIAFERSHQRDAPIVAGLSVIRTLSENGLLGSNTSHSVRPRNMFTNKHGVPTVCGIHPAIRATGTEPPADCRSVGGQTSKMRGITRKRKKSCGRPSLACAAFSALRMRSRKPRSRTWLAFSRSRASGKRPSSTCRPLQSRWIPSRKSSSWKKATIFNHCMETLALTRSWPPHVSASLRCKTSRQQSSP